MSKRTVYKKNRPDGWWLVKDHVIEEARKYKTISEFSKHCSAGYGNARKNGWLKDCTWFIPGKKPANYWNKERCIEESKKYKTRSEFKTGCPSAYRTANIHRWLNECTWLEPPKNIYRNGYLIYKFEFTQTHSVYIGLTCRPDKRLHSHNTDPNSSVFIHAKKHDIPIPEMKILETNLSPTDAQKQEEFWVKKFKSENWNVLNRGITGFGRGSLGAVPRKWDTKEKVLLEARKYATRDEFARGCGSAYNKAVKMKWLDECTWFRQIRMPKGYWTDERVIEESKKYNSKGEFRRNSPRAFDIARNHKLFGLCTWLEPKRKPSGYWSKERISELSKIYNTRADFRRNEKSAYEIAIRNHWLNEIFPKRHTSGK